MHLQLSDIFSRCYKSLVIHGFKGSLKVSVGHLDKLFKLNSDKELTKTDSADFDLKYGVDTGGILYPKKNEVTGSNWRYGIRYNGCNYCLLNNILNELSIDFQKFTFIDLGSGKGRAILQASVYPFNKIYGVEYSKSLNDIALRNISIFPKSEIRCNSIDSICADATKFSFPEGQLIVFLNNPFSKTVMNIVVKNLIDSFTKNPRQIFVIYFNSEFESVWKQEPLMKEICSIPTYLSVYCTQSYSKISLLF